MGAVESFDATMGADAELPYEMLLVRPAGSTGPGKLTPVLKEGYQIKQAAEQGSGDADDDESCELLEASETDVFNWSGQTEQNGQGDSDADDDESGELLEASDADVIETWQYQPLSYWEKQGFDTKVIAENCTDTREHQIFGTIYRVDVEQGHAKSACYQQHQQKTGSSRSNS